MRGALSHSRFRTPQDRTGWLKVKGECQVDEADRLYLENGEKAATSNSMPLALAALLPISAVLSFVAGSRFSKYRSQQGAREADCEQLMMEGRKSSGCRVT